MYQPLAHLYDLALRGLDEQERRVDALRGRLGPVLAAAALGTTLLGGPAIGGRRSDGVLGTVAIAVTVVGLLITLGTAAHLLRAVRVASFDADPHRLAVALSRDGVLDDLTRFYWAMIEGLGVVRVDNERGIRRLSRTFTSMMCGILVMECGLALAVIVG